jgi:hypothetical protein
MPSILDHRPIHTYEQEEDVKAILTKHQFDLGSSLSAIVTVTIHA